MKSVVALGLVAAAARVVPADMRRDWRREWIEELRWCAQDGRLPSEQRRRARGAVRHALWLRVERWRRGMFRQDLRYAVRALRARPTLTVAAILSLALGIGANLAIFTVVNGVLLRPLPFADPERLVQLANRDNVAALSGPEVIDLARDTRALAAVGAYALANGNLTGGRDEAERVAIARVSAGFFGVLLPRLAAGRALAPDEDRPGAPASAVISAPVAVRYFGDRRDAVGGRLTLDGIRYNVVGVAPAEFEFPTAAVDVWVPLALDPSAPGERRNHSYSVIGRLTPGVTMQAAEADVQAIVDGWRLRYPSDYSRQRAFAADVVSLADRVVGASRPYLIAMLGAVALVLLIACVNVAGLLLSYGDSRRKEFAIAAALGASRARLAVRSISESVVLASAGGALGLGLAIPAYRLLVDLAGVSIPRLSGVRLDPTVLAVAFAVSLVTALLSGAVPLVRTLRECDAAALRTAGRSGGPAGGRGTERVQAVLVVGEIALAVTLLGGAGLLARSLLNLQHVDLGFHTDHVLTATISLPRTTYTDARASAAVDGVVGRLSHAPGVSRVSAMAWLPVVDGGGMWSVMGDAETPATNADAPTAAPQQVTAGFFATLQIPILRGRDFRAADSVDAELVGIVNESLARLLWHGANPIGRRFRMFSPTAKWITVVGLVPDTRVNGITVPPPPSMYFPYAQAGASAYFMASSMTLAVNYQTSVAPVTAMIRQTVHEVDADIPVSQVRTLDDVVGSTIARERFAGALIGGFALLAILLAGVGVYAMVAYLVTQRRFEIGVRLALGATKGAIAASIYRRGLGLGLMGLAVGISGAASAGRLLQALLYGVGSVDPLVLLLIGLVTLVVIVAALFAPSRRAMTVDPAQTLQGR